MSIATQEKIADFVQNVKQMATEAVDKVCISLLKAWNFLRNLPCFSAATHIHFFQIGKNADSNAPKRLNTSN